MRDKHFSEKNNVDLVGSCKSIDLRRVELKDLTGDKLVYKEQEDKHNSATKAISESLELVIDDIFSVVKKMNSTKSDKVFNKIKQGADYAIAIYKEYIRLIEQLKIKLLGDCLQ